MDFNNKCYYTTQGNIKCNNDMIENFAYAPCGHIEGKDVFCNEKDQCCGKNKTCGGNHSKKSSYCSNKIDENYYIGHISYGKYDYKPPS